LSVVYRFGPFHLDTAEDTLTRNGNRVKLQDLPYRLLVMLLEQPGQIISREAVRQRLWPENTFVEFDNSLGVAVRKIRDAEAPRYLETLPRKGYRFLAPVSVAEPEIAQHEENHLVPSSVQAAPLQASANSAGRNNPLYLYSSTAALAVLLIAAAIWGIHASRKHPPQNSASLPTNAPVLMRKSVAVIGFRNLPGHPEDNWLSLAFAEMLNTELAADSALRMVSGEDCNTTAAAHRSRRRCRSPRSLHSPARHRRKEDSPRRPPARYGARRDNC
jgi:DNA-binding winged helix-turn-helix (wHTH) protein